jgi:hypothetical protein
MKKATLIIVALTVLSAGSLRAEEGMVDEITPTHAPAPAPQAPPLLLASSLPGMTDRHPANHLPGMSPVSRALPQPLITDLSNAPNPFDSRKGGLEGQTQISYQLVKDAKVSLEIYDLLGRKVRGWTFDPGASGGRTGANQVLWDGTDGSGRKVSKGGYLAEIVIETPEATVTAVRKIGVIH